MKNKLWNKKVAVAGLLCFVVTMGYNAVETKANTEIVISESTFPDENFREYIANKVDTDKNGKISQGEIEGCTFINVYHKDIKSLEGIDFFSNLTKLNCADNELTELSLSNEGLKKVDCGKNQLTDIKVNDCKNLQELMCNDNKLQELDIAELVSLEYLDCRNNEIKELSLKGVKKISEVYCGNNAITTLDFESTPEISSIQCQENQLEEINLKGCSKLRILECNNNQLKTLDVSESSVISDIYCQDNQLTVLNLGNQELLTTLCCQNNQLTKLDVSKCKALVNLNCSNNKLQSLNVDNCENLQNIFVDENTVIPTETVTLNVTEGSEVTVTPKTTPETQITIEPTNAPKPTATMIPTIASEEEKTYTITYELKGGKNNSKNPASYGSNPVTLETPKKYKHTFGGWFLDDSYQKKITEITPNMKKNITVYAKWNKVSVAKVTLKSVKNNKKNSAKITFKKVSGAKSYEVVYAQDKKFKKAKKLIVKKTTATIKKLKKGKTYYVRVRAFKYDGSKNKIYGKYSKIKKVVIKK